MVRRDLTLKLLLGTTGQLPNYLYEEGPVTRRKENLLQKINEEPQKELDSVQKFDEFYKNNKNVEHEVYFYKKPRINPERYQADMTYVNDIFNEFKKNKNKNDNEDLKMSKFTNYYSKKIILLL